MMKPQIQPRVTSKRESVPEGHPAGRIMVLESTSSAESPNKPHSSGCPEPCDSVMDGEGLVLTDEGNCFVLSGNPSRLWCYQCLRAHRLRDCPFLSLLPQNLRDQLFALRRQSFESDRRFDSRETFSEAPTKLSSATSDHNQGWRSSDIHVSKGYDRQGPGSPARYTPRRVLTRDDPPGKEPASRQ
jgi:hypothetical protein